MRKLLLVSIVEEQVLNLTSLNPLAQDFFMDFTCCADDAALVASESRDNVQSLTALSAESPNSHDQTNKLNSDYRTATPLFKAIELEDWKGIVLFLKTGRWSNSLFSSSNSYLQDPSPERQTRTWITCRGNRGEVQWRQLPIHAAVSYMAPLPVIRLILELYPDAIRCADDTGNLPLHLAFGFGSNDNVVAYLVKEYPQALSVEGLQNRRPLDCCELGPSKARGDIIQACQENTRMSLMKDWDTHWKKGLADAKVKAGLEDIPLSNFKTLDDVFNELFRVKSELQKAKEISQTRPTMIITKTELAPRAPSQLAMTSSESAKGMSLGQKGSVKVTKGSIGTTKSNSNDGTCTNGARKDISKGTKKKKQSFFRALKLSPSAPVAPTLDINVE